MAASAPHCKCLGPALLILHPNRGWRLYCTHKVNRQLCATSPCCVWWFTQWNTSVLLMRIARTKRTTTHNLERHTFHLFFQKQNVEACVDGNIGAWWRGQDLVVWREDAHWIRRKLMKWWWGGCNCSVMFVYMYAGCSTSYASVALLQKRVACYRQKRL